MSLLLRFLLSTFVLLIAMTAMPTSSSADTGPNSPNPSNIIAQLDGPTSRETAIRIGCVSPKMSRYYGPALRDIAMQRWGFLRESLRQGTIDLVADAVYDIATKGDGDSTFVQFVGDVRPGDRCTSNELGMARKTIDGAGVATELAKCSMKPPIERRRDPACSLAEVVATALTGDSDATQLRLADLVASVSFAAIYDGKSLSEWQQSVLFDHIDRALQGIAAREDGGPGDRTIDDDIKSAFEGIDLDEVHDDRCDDGDLVKVLAVGAPDDTEAFCVATRPVLELDKTTIIVTGPAPGNARYETNLGAVERTLIPEQEERDNPARRPPLTDDEAAQGLICSLPLNAADRTAAGCSGKPPPAPSGMFKINVGGSVTWEAGVVGRGDTAHFTVTGGAEGSVLRLVNGAAVASELRADVTAFIRHQMLGEAPTPTMMRELSISALRLKRVAEAFRRLPLEAADHQAYVVGTVEALPSIVANASARHIVAHVEPPSCDRATTPLARIRCLARPGGALRPVLIAAEGARVRELTSRLSSVFMPSSSIEATACTTRSTHGRFFAALAGYTLDDGNGTRASDAQSDALAAEQLRAASADLQRCSATSGIGRTMTSEIWGTSIDLRPSPAFRMSWNNAYRNEAIGDGYRILPSFDWLIGRVRFTPRTAHTYVGLQASVADLAAPFTELAMRRREIIYVSQKTLWLEFLKPRLEVTFGIPAATQHVLLSAGLSVRTAAPFQSAVDRMQYVSVDNTPRHGLASFIEYNAGVKYVF